MRRLSYLILSLAAFGLLQAPTLGQTKKEQLPDPLKTKEILPDPLKKPLPPVQCGPSFKNLDGQLLVFVVNGAGGSTTLSENLLDVNEELHLGLRIQQVPWSRTLSVWEDLVDNQAQINAAARIACSVKAIRQDAPNAHIFFIGQSAGARVVLVAAEMLPPKSIDRVIVVAPAVTSGYDLMSALKATRYGIDNFFSPEDGTLETASEKSPLADGIKGPAAGRFGFRPLSSDPKVIDAYRCSVRQYRWTDSFHGNGGHFAWTIRHNMKKWVPPMICQAPVTEVYSPPPPPIIDKKAPAK
jgi:pimeloyl-ACP methyl ester carboxylesterase